MLNDTNIEINEEKKVQLKKEITSKNNKGYVYVLRYGIYLYKFGETSQTNYNKYIKSKFSRNYLMDIRKRFGEKVYDDNKQLHRIIVHRVKSPKKVEQIIREIIINNDSCLIRARDEFFETKIDIYTIISQIYENIFEYILQY